jgi:hypothetical protein
MLRAAIAFAVLAATSTPAWPCLNGTIMEGDEAVRALAQAEALIDAGQYGQAGGILGTDSSVHWMDERLLGRVYDAQVVIALRTAPRRAAKNALAHFAQRSKAQPKNLRYQAWLAEAYAALNKREEALAILTDLHKRDLMPDGFAYVTIAKLSDGAEVEQWLDVCRTRAKVKSICVIPRTVAKPVKVVRSTKMKL